MGDIYEATGLAEVRVVGFTGRESDAPLGIWGAISGRGKDWRKAGRFALTENPVSDYQSESVDLPLFKLGEETAEWKLPSTKAVNGGSRV